MRETGVAELWELSGGTLLRPLLGSGPPQGIWTPEAMSLGLVGSFTRQGYFDHLQSSRSCEGTRRVLFLTWEFGRQLPGELPALFAGWDATCAKRSLKSSLMLAPSQG